MAGTISYKTEHGLELVIPAAGRIITRDRDKLLISHNFSGAMDKVRLPPRLVNREAVIQLMLYTSVIKTEELYFFNNSWP
jgi:hypothetical protein